MALAVLIVDSDRHRADALAVDARKYRGEVVTRHSFEDGRKEILLRAPILLVAHAHVGMSQGVHLAQAAIRANGRAHAVIYGSVPELVLARDMFNTRVFFVRLPFLHRVLPHYLMADLPDADRRDVRVAERRTTFRGGRRASDVEPLWAEVALHA